MKLDDTMARFEFNSACKNISKGIRSRAARQQAQIQAVEAGGSGFLSRWTGGPGTKSVAAQS